MRSCLLTLFLLGVSSAGASTLSWQAELGEESSWSRVTYAGTLLTASEESLSHFEFETGELLWQRQDLAKLAQFNVSDVAGTPFLVIIERLGNIPPKSRLQVLNISTGETLWDTGELAGAGLGAFPMPEQGLLVFVADLHGEKPGSYVIAYALDSGEERWRTKLGSAGTLPTHASDIGGFIPSPDLNGHPQPIVADGQMILVAGNLFAIDLETGEQRWNYKLKASIPNLKNTYAQPLLVDGTLYAAGRDSIHVIDAASGAALWKAKLGKSQIPQLEMVGNLLVGRLGGTFSNGKQLVQSKPFGAFAVNVETQAVAWKWTKGKDSITNFRVDADQGLVVLADKKNLYGLDLNASKKGKVVFKNELEFKRKMGNTELAAKGLGVASGLLGGGLAGGLKGLGGGGDRGDPPLDVDLINGQLVVRAQYHVLSHNLATQTSNWSIEFAPPGMSGFALIAMGAVTATMAVSSAGASRASTGSTANAYADSALSITNAFQDAAAKRYAAAEKARSTAFFLTKEEEDGMVLLGIDLDSGDEIGRVPMNEKEPQFMVDDAGSRVYYFRNKTELLAYDF